VKSAVFTRRLVVFHETFAPLLTLNNTISVVWHEGITGRSTDDIASNFISAMKAERDISHFTFWLDNCGAQNKNWTIFTAIVTYVNTTLGPESVNFKYFITGHTFMSADAFHSKVELSMKHKKVCMTFQTSRMRCHLLRKMGN